MLFAANSEGEIFGLQAKVTRKRIKKNKVKSLGPTEVSEGQIMVLAPFLEVWGKLDLLMDDKDDVAS